MPVVAPQCPHARVAAACPCGESGGSNFPKPPTGAPHTYPQASQRPSHLSLTWNWVAVRKWATVPDKHSPLPTPQCWMPFV